MGYVGGGGSGGGIVVCRVGVGVVVIVVVVVFVVFESDIVRGGCDNVGEVFWEGGIYLDFESYRRDFWV